MKKTPTNKQNKQNKNNKKKNKESIPKHNPLPKKPHKKNPKNIHTQSKTILAIPFRPSDVLATGPLSYLALQPLSYYESRLPGED